MTHLEQWRPMLDAPDPRAAVADHLAKLAATDECRALLPRLSRQLRRLETNDRGLLLIFEYVEYEGDECVVTCGPPYEGPAGDLPPSMLAAAAVHNGLCWEYAGGGFIGFAGLRDGRLVSTCWEPEILVDAGHENADFLQRLERAGLTTDDVESPADFGQNWLFWDPTERNALGEPVLCFVSHGDGVATPVTAARDLPFGAVLLRLMVQDILGEEVFEEVYS